MKLSCQTLCNIFGLNSTRIIKIQHKNQKHSYNMKSNIKIHKNIIYHAKRCSNPMSGLKYLILFASAFENTYIVPSLESMVA